MKKIIFFINFLIFVPIVQATFLEDYRESIEKKCKDVNILKIKKAMIEILNDDKQKCKGFFTQNIIQECKQIECTALYELLEEAKSKNSGNVVGE
jgi:hypothetical protein